jgi:hypothetical protein
MLDSYGSAEYFDLGRCATMTYRLWPVGNALSGVPRRALALCLPGKRKLSQLDNHGSSDSRMRGTSARDYQGISPVLSAPKERDISAQGKCGGVSRQTPPWGSFFISGEALKGRHKPLLTRDYCHGHARAVSPFQGFRSMPPDTQGGALACPGLICRRPFGAEDCASFSRTNLKQRS